MLKIAICDDNISELSNIVSIIREYQAMQRDKNSIHSTSFHNAMDLITAMESGQHYDLVLIDILMPFMNGMEAAKEIRQFNQAVKIIFMTSSPEFAVESYSVNAYYYALKPIWKEKLFLLLDKIISETELQSGERLLIKSKTGITRISINRLEYIEVIGRTIFYHLTDGSIIEAIGSLSELEKCLLSKVNFIKTHRSYIINLEHIDSLNQREVKMHSHDLVPMSKASVNTVKTAYINFSFKE